MRRSSYGGSLISGFLNLLYPSACPSCMQRADDALYAPFCSRCWSSIKPYAGPACVICANPLSSGSAELCGECMRLRPPFSKAVSFGLYEGVLASVLHHYKFGGIRRLHRPLSRLLPDIGLCADFLVPVPLSSAALRRRGFNQSLLITRRLSMEKGIPLVADGLVKNRDTRPQVGLNMRERASNLKGAFTATRSFSGKKVVLVDDVMTTGATVSECTAELLKAGADEVSVLTLARACVL